MMSRFLGWVMALSMAALAWSAVPAKKKATARKPSASASAKRAPARKAPAKSAAARNSKNSKKAPAMTWRNRQLAPTSQRYQEIQTALATKGYLRPESATGAWDPPSIDALKRFQADQNIESSGKINSLSLIALGLGPKREAPAKPAASPEQAPQTPDR